MKQNIILTLADPALGAIRPPPPQKKKKKKKICTRFAFFSLCCGQRNAILSISLGTTSLILRQEYYYSSSSETTHYADVIMTTIASQITSLTSVYSTVYSDADQRKHQSSASLAFVWGIHRDRWIPRTKGQLRGKCFHLMTSSCPKNTGKWTIWIKKSAAYIHIRTKIVESRYIKTVLKNVPHEHIKSQD